ncbi:hypothetical protein DAPPUDRAFT_122542 [Daphnia pulex]|uniref:Uncharacterized protein n=1 Tax=Daphnia pulex TaxID=6669 RepID=E9I4H6_DAPPU|nr:hypothetical protein DAPPUDRAFT_122542 [Daphnia pulex]|eukprot:EFX61103.1 hypothetical protein DAPPUDRAFT_122542 [Daphnia pulex]
MGDPSRDKGWAQEWAKEREKALRKPSKPKTLKLIYSRNYRRPASNSFYPDFSWAILWMSRWTVLFCSNTYFSKDVMRWMVDDASGHMRTRSNLRHQICDSFIRLRIH